MPANSSELYARQLLFFLKVVLIVRWIKFPLPGVEEGRIVTIHPHPNLPPSSGKGQYSRISLSKWKIKLSNLFFRSCSYGKKYPDFYW